MTREQKLAVLIALSARMCTSHYWRNAKHVALPFTGLQLNEHLAGAGKFGLCPIMPGTSYTQVGLLDLDDHREQMMWREKWRIAETLLVAFELRDLTPMVFRSSGGAGIHIIVSWDAPQDAYSVRTLLEGVLTSCDLTNGVKGLEHGQAEVFPKQNSVPPGGSGNMFVLPFAKHSQLLITGEEIEP